MNILRQLWQDTQSVLRDMSVTQRLAVTCMVLTVAVWLTFAAWMGTTPGETGRRPLPVEVEPGDVNDMIAQLKLKGIKTAEYDYDNRRILVNADEERNAVIALAEDGLLKEAHAFGFNEMLDRWSFSDTRMRSEEAMRLARSNEVARLIENLDSVKEAQVIYSDDARNSLFGLAHKKTAAVRIRTKLKKPLTETEANTIISIVASAKAGLDERDVVVTDQMGNKFHASASNGLTAMGKQKWDYEFKLDEEMRRRLEAVIRQYVPNIQYEGDVNAFPKHEVAFDYREQTYREVLEGQPASTRSSKISRRSNRRPSEEPGVQPNVRRSANLSNPWGWYVDETSEDIKEAERVNENSIRETATRFAPSVTNLTVSAIIHLPYQLKRDADGNPVQAMNEQGEPLIDPESRMTMWERESTTLLSPAQVEELKRQIALAAGIPIADIPEKIEVSQVAWMPPVHAPRGGESQFRHLIAQVRENLGLIASLFLFIVAGLVMWYFTSRPIPTEVEDPIEPETISLAMTHDDDDDEQGDEEWDKLRAKVVAAVQEDPKRAANLLKRWMRKD